MVESEVVESSSGMKSSQNRALDGSSDLSFAQVGKPGSSCLRSTQATNDYQSISQLESPDWRLTERPQGIGRKRLSGDGTVCRILITEDFHMLNDRS